MFLRPLVVKNDARLEVRAAGQELRTKRLAHVQPSEMIRFTLDPEGIRVVHGETAASIEVALR